MATRLGMTLKRLRIKAGLTQDELARKAGVTYAYISMLESGTKKNPSLMLVKKLAKALGVSIADLAE